MPEIFRYLRRGAERPLVVVDQRPRLLAVDLEALLHRLLAGRRRAGSAARRCASSLPCDLGRVELDVVDAARAGMHAPAAHARDDLVVRHVDLEHVVERHALASSAPRPAGWCAGSRRTGSRCAQSGCFRRSFTRPMMMSSDTSWPASITFFAARPSGVPALTAARSMSPVEICGMPNFSRMNCACVPFPAPGGPRRISLMKAFYARPRDPRRIDARRNLGFADRDRDAEAVPEHPQLLQRLGSSPAAPARAREYFFRKPTR